MMTMPCPTCEARVPHTGVNETTCQACGTVLKMLMPLFAAQAQPYGWKWAAVCASCGEKMTDAEALYARILKMPATCTGCMGGPC